MSGATWPYFSVAVTRLAAAACAALCLLAMTGCDKPTEEDCRKAVENIRRLYDTSSNEVGAPPAAVLRSCVGGEDPASVRCFIAAQTKEDLAKCEGSAMAKLFATDNADEKPEADKTSDPGTNNSDKKTE